MNKFILLFICHEFGHLITFQRINFELGAEFNV